jgi:2-polyprenyl-3-methyl-5-hydroxy-6-metoxy-1,4-benzoquinol methylase
VLEHVDNPRQALKKAAALLKLGGILVINTPDTGSSIARFLKSLWHQYIPPEHIALFNEKNITTLLKETGFTVLSIQHIGKRFTLRYMIETLTHHVRIPLLTPILEKIKKNGTLGGLWVPLNLYDNMTVLAKKI